MRSTLRLVALSIAVTYPLFLVFLTLCPQVEACAGALKATSSSLVPIVPTLQPGLSHEALKPKPFVTLLVQLTFYCPSIRAPPLDMS